MGRMAHYQGMGLQSLCSQMKEGMQLIEPVGDNLLRLAACFEPKECPGSRVRITAARWHAPLLWLRTTGQRRRPHPFDPIEVAVRLPSCHRLRSVLAGSCKMVAPRRGFRVRVSRTTRLDSMIVVVDLAMLTRTALLA